MRSIQTSTAFKSSAGGDFGQLTVHKSKRNKFAVSCAACGRIFYTDRKTADQINRLITRDLDYPFLCGDCKPATGQFYER